MMLVDNLQTQDIALSPYYVISWPNQSGC